MLFYTAYSSNYGNDNNRGNGFYGNDNYANNNYGNGYVGNGGYGSNRKITLGLDNCLIPYIILLEDGFDIV